VVNRRTRKIEPNAIRGFFVSATAALLLSACATGIPGLGPKSADGGGAAITALPELGAEGPSAATAVVENSYTIDGAILPVVRGTSRTGTRADMRRSDSLINFDNRFLNVVAGDRRSADIVRIDRQLVWTLEPANRRYTECPLTGCAQTAQPAQKPTEERKPDQPAKPTEPECPVTVKTNELKVLSSGERKTVNGFATERFQIGWTVEIEDKQGRRNGNKVMLDLWTTPEAGAVKDVQQIGENYQRRYASALNAGDNPIGKFVPREVLGAMSAMMKNIDPRDAKTLAAWGSELRKVRGYPILTNMTWNSEGSVCSESQARAGGGSQGLGGLLGGILGGGRPAGSTSGASGNSAPLVSYSNEVKTLAVRPVSDTLFVPPADYQRK
jgi:hypothetical protein